MEKIEYTLFGKKLEKIAIAYGLFLILWGIIITFISGSNSFTSLIPSFLGLLVFIFSYLAAKFSEKKMLFMHIVVSVGFIIFIGGFRVLSNIGNLFADKFWADISQIMMLVTGGLFIYHCMKSFIFARKNK